MNIIFSLPIDSFEQSADALQFIRPFIRIAIPSIMSPRSFQGGYHSFALEEACDLLRQHGDNNFMLSSEAVDGNDDENSFVFRRDPYLSTASFSCQLQDEEAIDLRSLIVASASLGLTFAFKYDFWKSYWQSVELVNTYQYNKRPYAHLKTYMEPNRPSVLGHKVDISENPGHRRTVYQMELMAAPEMWFGPGAWKYFDRQRVSGIQGLPALEEWGNDVLYIKLFDWDTPDYEAAPILDLQRKFRAASGMDKVEKLLLSRLAISG